MADDPAGAGLVQRIDAADDPEREAVYFIIERLAVKQPELAEALRYCAIPRRYDATLVALLRNSSSGESNAIVASDEDRRIVADLARFSFVHPYAGGEYGYDEAVRSILLTAWQKNDRREAFDKFSRRLVDHYERLHSEAQQLEEAFLQVGSIVKEASQARYVQLASALDARLTAPLVEAIYHATMQSLSGGNDLFTRHFEYYEGRGRLPTCRALVAALRMGVEALQASKERAAMFHWLRYWDARVARQVGQYDEAVKILEDLLPQVGDDERLALWVLGDHGNVLQQQERLQEAGAFLQKAVKRAERSGGDPYNLSVWYDGLASVYWRLEQLAESADAYNQAIRAAQGVGNAASEAYSRLNLSGVLQDLGRQREATASLLSALALARSRSAKTSAVQVAAAERAMSIFAGDEPRLLDTIFKELEALVDPAATLTLFNARKFYAGLLRRSGQLRRAEQQFSVLEGDAEEFSGTVPFADLQFQQALLRESQGRLEEAIATYTRIVTAPPTSWYAAAARLNRGLQNSKLARWPEAEADLLEAKQAFESTQCRILAAAADLGRADNARRQGRIAQAQELLDQAKGSLAGGPPTYAIDIHVVQAEIYEQQASWSKAQEQYQHALAHQQAMGRISAVAETMRRLAGIAEACGRWDDAATYAAQAQQAWGHLARQDVYAPSKQARPADEANARGLLKHLAPASAAKSEAVVAARDFFRIAASQAPEGFWYHLNLAFACAELEEWVDAARAIEAARKAAPASLDSSVLDDWIVRYQLQHVDALQANSDRLLKQDIDDGGALEGLLRALDVLKRAATDDTKRLAALHSRLGFVYSRRHEVAGSRANFRQGLDHFRANSIASPGEELGRLCHSLLNDVASFWALIDEWQQFEEDWNTADWIRTELSAARRVLLQYLDEAYNLTKTTGHLLPIVTPIAIEIGARLVPSDTSATSPLFTTHIPALRERMRADRGVLVPGIKVRGGPAGSEDEGYTILIEEIPVASGRVRADMGYVPKEQASLLELGIPEQGLDPDSHLVTAAAGCWVSEAYWHVVTDRGIELWDPMQYALRHLEGELRRNLEKFVGMQEAEEMLDRWKQEAVDDATIQSALSDPALRVRLARVLRSLVSDRVAVTAGMRILHAALDGDVRNQAIDEMVTAARRELKSFLPGNEVGATRIRLDSEWENRLTVLAKTSDSAELALPALDAHRLVSDLRASLREAKVGAVLVTQGAIRARVRRLLQRDFPDLLVLAKEEQTSADASLFMIQTSNLGHANAHGESASSV